MEHGNPNTVNQALKTLVVIAPDKALPIVFENFRSADSHRRKISVELLNQYPATNLEIQAAMQQPASDPDPALARRARELMTKQYQTEHPIESQFSDDPSVAGKSLGEWLKAHDSACRNECATPLRDGALRLQQIFLLGAKPILLGQTRLKPAGFPISVRDFACQNPSIV